MLLHITGEPRVRDLFAMGVIKIKYSSKKSEKKLNDLVYIFLPVVIIAFDVNNVASLSHVR